MALLSVANLVLSFGDRVILDGINLTVEPGKHIGMVGRNGCGKSTLLKLVAGWPGLKADSGQVQLARGASAGYLTQDPDLDANRTLRDEAATAFTELNHLHQEIDELTDQMASAQGDELEKLLKRYEQAESKMQAAGGYAVDHQIDATLHGLGLTDEFFDVNVGDLSGGQKGRLALAKLLLRSPNVLLLDEPTNHLDITGRQWLEEYLIAYNGAVILISHDRWLLDRVAHNIYEMQDGRLAEYPGNYQAFREQRVLRRLTQQRVYEKQQDKVKQEQAFIDRYRAGQRASQAQGRQKKLERFKQNELIERPIEQNEISLTFRPSTRCGDLVITAENISKAYEGKTLFADLSLQIKRGDRIGIIGPNGAGKSTLVRTLLGEQPPDSGTVRVGNSVDVGHYRQTHEGLDLSLTVVQYLQRFTASGLDQEARNLAGAFLFSGDEQDKPLGVLSGGERSRAVLAGLIVGGHNLLVLDEPTNHLDISSAEQLEAALKLFSAPPKGYGQKVGGGGTLILISHDRMLLEDIVDQLIVLDGQGNCQHILGTYSQHIASQHAQTEVKPSAPKRKNKKQQPTALGNSKVSPKASHRDEPVRHNAGLSKLSQKSLEQRIEKLESQLITIDQELADPDIYRDGQKVKQLQDQRTKLATKLTPLEEEWSRRAQA